jgi:hypothetical protein
MALRIAGLLCFFLHPEVQKRSNSEPLYSIQEGGLYTTELNLSLISKTSPEKVKVVLRSTASRLVCAGAAYHPATNLFLLHGNYL